MTDQEQIRFLLNKYNQELERIQAMLVNANHHLDNAMEGVTQKRQNLINFWKADIAKMMTQESMLYWVIADLEAILGE